MFFVFTVPFLIVFTFGSEFIVIVSHAFGLARESAKKSVLSFRFCALLPRNLTTKLQCFIFLYRLPVHFSLSITFVLCCWWVAVYDFIFPNFRLSRFEALKMHIKRTFAIENAISCSECCVLCVFLYSIGLPGSMRKLFVCWYKHILLSYHISLSDVCRYTDCVLIPKQIYWLPIWKTKQTRCYKSIRQKAYGRNRTKSMQSIWSRRESKWW